MPPDPSSGSRLRRSRLASSCFETWLRPCVDRLIGRLALVTGKLLFCDANKVPLRIKKWRERCLTSPSSLFFTEAIFRACTHIGLLPEIPTPCDGKQGVIISAEGTSFQGVRRHALPGNLRSQHICESERALLPVQLRSVTQCDKGKRRHRTSQLKYCSKAHNF